MSQETHGLDCLCSQVLIHAADLSLDGLRRVLRGLLGNMGESNERAQVMLAELVRYAEADEDNARTLEREFGEDARLDWHRQLHSLLRVAQRQAQRLWDTEFQCPQCDRPGLLLYPEPKEQVCICEKCKIKSECRLWPAHEELPDEDFRRNKEILEG
jgi:hypothetical protein